MINHIVSTFTCSYINIYIYVELLAIKKYSVFELFKCVNGGNCDSDVVTVPSRRELIRGVVEDNAWHFQLIQTENVPVGL